MALFKCKMCGGTLEINNNETVATCEYCGTGQTLPKLDDEKRANMYDRANHFRRNNEFDKAMGIYEQILNEDKTDAEAYWSLVLCRYGIEYVEDPASHKRVPTVNRAQFTSVFDDDNYKSALQYADVYQKAVYEEEAKTINEIQKGILAISQKEEPFDVFICYKETDNNGRRTQDSVLANDLYHQLTQEGFKVFFARITLEDKLGSAYEPYIFAALNSAKVMVVIGTKPEFFKAVWVRNEWSRYLSLIKQGQQKMLIPAYRDMDPYDLPEEFSHLQAQDMSKLGFMQDLIRGIKKIVHTDEPKQTIVKETVVTNVNSNTDPLLKRAFMFLEDGDFAKADEFCEQVLNQDPENVQAYIGKLMVELRVKKREDLKECEETFESLNNYQKIIRFADEEVKKEFEENLDIIKKNKVYREALSEMDADDIPSYERAAKLLETISGWRDADQKLCTCSERIEEIYLNKYTIAKNAMEEATQAHGYILAAKKFEEISQYKDSETLAKECYEKAEEIEKNFKYNMALANLNSGIKEHIEKAMIGFKYIGSWRDAEEKTGECKRKLDEIKENEEKERLERERAEHERLEQEENRRRKIKKRVICIIVGIISVVVIAVVAYFVTTLIIIPNVKYNKAIELMETGKYEEAIEEFQQLNGYKDSANKISECYLLGGMKVANVGDNVFFGTYEQDHNISNGKENVEWIVLEKNDDRVLLISKNALDCKKYNTSNTDVTWENCTLRKWLNTDFIDETFSVEEKSKIYTVTVSVDKNPEYSTNPGKATQDQVFLLSIDEVNRYFISDSARQCKPTDDLVRRGAVVNIDNGNCWWWLRSPGSNQNLVAGVKSDGTIDGFGASVNSSSATIRPAMWIDINA